ncbi:MAG: hypothetical protein ACMXYF_03445 [Candidatus Woesearchaeota archaeon]
MKSFEEYITLGIVQKITPDNNRAQSLLLEAHRKHTTLLKNAQSLGINDENANDFIEYSYNSIMFLIRSKLFSQGYKCSGQGAHEAEVSFTYQLQFTESQVRFLDELRYFRNGILYYGKRFDGEYAKKSSRLQNRFFKK